MGDPTRWGDPRASKEGLLAASNVLRGTAHVGDEEVPRTRLGDNRIRHSKDQFKDVIMYSASSAQPHNRTCLLFLGSNVNVVVVARSVHSLSLVHSLVHSLSLLGRSHSHGLTHSRTATQTHSYRATTMMLKSVSKQTLSAT